MYLILGLPLLSGFIAQIAKMLIKNNNQKLGVKNLLAYSGMPSGHSAMVISLSTIIGLVEGFNTSIFAVSFIFAIVVIRDALGIRRYLGQHGKVLNILVKDLNEDQVLDEHYPHLLEKIGHTLAQVLVGSLIGIVVSVIGYYISI